MQITIGKALLVAAGVVGIAVAAASCENKAEQKQAQAPSGALGASASLKDLMAARGLSESDVEAALKTYVPGGKTDDYIIFASGGQPFAVGAIGYTRYAMIKGNVLYFFSGLHLPNPDTSGIL